MGIVVGFIPWIVYWILVGNVPFTLAVTIAFGITLLIQIALRIRKQPAHTLDIGNLIVFAVLVAAAYLVPQDVLERWLQPLSSLGLLLIALGGLLIGRPFVREYAVASVDAETAKTSGFRTITNAMTWMWVGAFAIMFLSSLIPPIVDGDATILDLDDPLSIICYWVIPYTVMGIAGTISAVFPPWFDKKSAEVDKRSAVAPVVSPQAAPPPDVAVDGLTITAPADTRLDEPFAITVDGGKAGSTIEVTTFGDDLFGRRWRSRAAFTVPADGVLDLSVVEPHGIDGQDPDWTTADRTAPIWAMRFDDDDATPEMFVPPAEPWQLTVEASGVGAVGSTQSGTASQPVSGRRTVLRRTGAAGLRYEPTDVNGLPGMLILPPGEAPAAGWPGVAVFGGSEGGFESQLSNAAVLASRGYAALAQAWISEADAAVTVSEVPLERFAAALDCLAGHDAVDRRRVSAMAISRGSEGLLATACRGLGPALSAMVLVSPSCVTWQALGSSGEVPDTASWNAGGQPVPWVPLSSGVLMRQIIRNAWTVGRDIAKKRPSLLRLRPAYEASLTAAGLLDRRGAPVFGATFTGGGFTADSSGAGAGSGSGAGAGSGSALGGGAASSGGRRGGDGKTGTAAPGVPAGDLPAGALLDAAAVRCPVLLIAGAEDQLWPSAPMAQILAAQRAAVGLDHQLLTYPGAGHLIRLGLLPTDAQWTNGIAFGGSREGLAHAQADATERVAAFLGSRMAPAG